MLCIKFTPTKQFFLKAGHLNRGDDHLNCGGVTSIVVGTRLFRTKNTFKYGACQWYYRVPASIKRGSLAVSKTIIAHSYNNNHHAVYICKSYSDPRLVCFTQSVPHHN